MFETFETGELVGIDTIENFNTVWEQWTPIQPKAVEAIQEFALPKRLDPRNTHIEHKDNETGILYVHDTDDYTVIRQLSGIEADPLYYEVRATQDKQIHVEEIIIGKGTTIYRAGIAYPPETNPTLEMLPENVKQTIQGLQQRKNGNGIIYLGVEVRTSAHGLQIMYELLQITENGYLLEITQHLN
ncbi:MAG: hypothetical protein R3B92_04575 [Patescibacteria group bacterium]